MKRLMSCTYNIDNCYLEMRFVDKSMSGIKFIAMENDIANNIYRSSRIFAKKIKKLCNVFGSG